MNSIKFYTAQRYLNINQNVIPLSQEEKSLILQDNSEGNIINPQAYINYKIRVKEFN